MTNPPTVPRAVPGAAAAGAAPRLAGRPAVSAKRGLKSVDTFEVSPVSTKEMFQSAMSLWTNSMSFFPPRMMKSLVVYSL